MLSRFVLPCVAAAGFGFAVVSIARANRPPIAANPIAQPPRAPFTRFIAGSGIVEPRSQCVEIGSPLARCVAEVLVRVGDEVEAGAPLFVLEGRDLRAELLVHKAALDAAVARRARLDSMPRLEEVGPAKAQVANATAHLANAELQLKLAQNVADSRAISLEELERRRHARAAASASVDEARGRLQLIEAGAWQADLEVAAAEEASARALVTATEVEIERLTVRAPMAGTVLQVRVRPGEFAPAGELQEALVTMGAVHPLHVRVDIDENDAWRFRPGAAATGSLRGNRDICAQLHFEYLEPYVIPKRSLTGDTAERVDTRVMQVLFSFERGELPILVGQQMDVFIESDDVVAPEVEGTVKQ